MTADHGGKRKGAGRKPGAASQKTREIAERAMQDGITPLEYMLSVMRSPFPPEIADKIKEGAIDGEILGALSGWHSMRMEAAKSAAPYVHPKLTAIHTTGGPEQKLEDWLESIPDEEV